MKPWAQWFVDHHLRWLLVALLPIHLPVGLVDGLRGALKNIRQEFRDLMAQPRTRR